METKVKGWYEAPEARILAVQSEGRLCGSQQAPNTVERQSYGPADEI